MGEKKVMEKSLESWKMYYLCMVTGSNCALYKKATPIAVCKKYADFI
jgi:hypothetical protein